MDKISVETPKDLSGALEIMSKSKLTPLAGGTDLMVQQEFGSLKAKQFINIWNLNELKGITHTNDSFRLGALTTFMEIRKHKLLKQKLPMLVQAAKLVGAIAIQNRATIAGNIANASPAADSVPALLCYDASLELTSTQKKRIVPLKDFYLGYKKMDIQSDELITAIIIPMPKDNPTIYYQKVGARLALSISKVCFAALVQMQSGKLVDVRISIGSIAPTPLRLYKTEDYLKQKKLNASIISNAIEQLADEIKPIDDIRSSKEYRVKVSTNLFRNFLESL
ncbi:MAG: xanthine dehydrogenase family protein subunit M [Bacteriovoracaceae bacterium]|nr:xanthine dehydrogenase family protein subunit M [Bacteriovoracaceae bacterium]